MNKDIYQLLKPYLSDKIESIINILLENENIVIIINVTILNIC